VAGKTGTAQVRRIHKHRTHISNMDWEHRDHAWFAAIAPAEKPEIVVVVLAEHSGHGGTAAAPVAREVLATYFEKKRRAAAAPLPPLDQEKPEENSKSAETELEGD
jgi:penicillin-binding protein 2